MSNITQVHLMQVPLENDYKHTLYFENRQAQENYFKSKIQVSYTNFTYQRKDEKIRVEAHYDSIINCNYVMYQNTAFNNKWFYAFIVDKKYISDGVTEIYIETDVMQTWLMDYALKQCFVEREHTADDTIGANTVPEALETGEYICNDKKFSGSTNRGIYILASTTIPYGNFENTGAGIYNGSVSGWKYYCYSSTSDIQTALENLAKNGKADSVVTLFAAPYYYVDKTDNRVTESVLPNSMKWSEGAGNQNYMQEKIYKPSTLNGYKPKNNKLLTFPYCYLLMSNNAGGAVVYHYELFNDMYEPNICDFRIYYAITPGGSMRLIPLDYGVYDPGKISSFENNEYGLNAGKLPVFGWQNDIYTNWLTQNARNIQVQKQQAEMNMGFSILNGFSSIVGSAATGNVAGAVGGGMNMAQNFLNSGMQIKAINAQVEQHSFQPPAASGNVNNGDVTYSMGNDEFTAYQMSIKAEYAKIIDDYFTMFGYETHRVKVPNKNHRSRFWYTKTIDCELDGAMPNKDMQIIKNVYNKGVTFWRSAEDIAIYNTPNTIV